LSGDREPLSPSAIAQTEPKVLCDRQKLNEKIGNTTFMQLSKTTIQELAQISNPTCVSIYMPTHPVGEPIRQDPIRLKNLLREAENKLTAKGLRPADIREQFAPLTRLLEDQAFWQHQNLGLALFLTSDLFRFYCLPMQFEELVITSDRFHCKPLIPLLTNNGQFYILALSQNQIRLFQATRYAITPVDLEDVPQSLAEALKYDDPEEQLQFHSVGNSTPIYHGQGVGTTDNKTAIWRYFQKVDAGLQELGCDRELPVVLAGVEYLWPIYREVNSYLHLLPEGIAGSPDHLKPEELHEQAWQVVCPYFQQQQQQALERYHQQVGTGQATSRLETVVQAAHRGQIDTLLTGLNAHLWGKFDPQTQTVEVHSSAEPDDEELLDLATLQTFLQGGTVYALEPEQMPDRSSLAAIFRYPIAAGQANINKNC
jgi:hypothetical protein